MRVINVTERIAVVNDKVIGLNEFINRSHFNRKEASIHQIRFVPQMPVIIDITIPGIALNSTDDKIALKCDSVIPQAMGGEVPRYKVTGLKGEIVDDELWFSLNFGSFPTSFRGARLKK